MTDESLQGVRLIVLILLMSLAIAAGIDAWLCQFALRSPLGWQQILLLAFGLVLATALIFALVVWTLRLPLGEHLDLTARNLILGTLPAALWLPALVLLMREQSALTAIVPVWIAACLVRFLKASTVSLKLPIPSQPMAVTGSGLFEMQNSPSLIRAVLPSACTALAWESSVGLMAAGFSFVAGLVLAAGMVFPLWTLSRNPATPMSTMGRHRSLFVNGLLATLCTAVVLMPLARDRGLSSAMGALLQGRPAGSPDAAAKKAEHASGGKYSGIVLYLPPKPAQIIAPSVSGPAPLSVLRKRAIVIPFDGVYWYFQFPDDRPGPDAPVLRGDPVKVNVRAENNLRLIMEAHQMLAAPMPMDCCSAIRVTFRNAERNAGALYMGVKLESGPDKHHLKSEDSFESLDNMLVPSSMGHSTLPTGQGVDETLTFPFPRHSTIQTFNEITILIQPVRASFKVGAHLAVQQFELLP